MQALVAEPEALHGADAKVFDHDICLAQHVQQYRLAGLGFHIDRGAALVTIQDHEGGGFAVDLWRHHAPGIVTAGYLFDLDDVRAHVREQLPAHGARHDMREFNYFKTGQGSRC